MVTPLFQSLMFTLIIYHQKNIPPNSKQETKTIIDWYIKYVDDDYDELNHQVKSPKINLKFKDVVAVHLPIKIKLSIVEWLFLLIQFYLLYG